MKTITVSEATKLLKENGFELTSQKGSHRKFTKGSFACNIVVHSSPKETLSPGIWKQIKETIKKSKDAENTSTNNS